jgi:hypothetical protein
MTELDAHVPENKRRLTVEVALVRAPGAHALRQQQQRHTPVIGCLNQVSQMSRQTELHTLLNRLFLELLLLLLLLLLLVAFVSHSSRRRRCSLDVRIRPNPRCSVEHSRRILQKLQISAYSSCKPIAKSRG